MNWIAFFSVFCVFIAAPAIVFGFIFLLRRSKTRIEELMLRKDLIELEIKKEALRLEAIREENRKYDRILSGNIDATGRG
jgi:hypothetical protein